MVVLHTTMMVLLPSLWFIIAGLGLFDMSSSTMDAVKEIQRICNEISALEKNLVKYVNGMCNTLSTNLLSDGQLPGSDSGLKAKLKKHLSDIYWTLKLHLLFHLGVESALEHKILEQFGKSLELTDDELKILPGVEHAIDPGSKVLEAVSITIFITKAEKYFNLYKKDCNVKKSSLK